MDLFGKSEQEYVWFGFKAKESGGIANVTQFDPSHPDNLEFLLNNLLRYQAIIERSFNLIGASERLEEIKLDERLEEYRDQTEEFNDVIELWDKRFDIGRDDASDDSSTEAEPSNGIEKWQNTVNEAKSD